MSCCGNQRSSIRAPRKAAGAGSPPPPPAPVGPPRAGVVLEYAGRGELLLVGHLSGRRYHFPRPGARLTVDAEDARRFSEIATLRPV